MDALQPIEPETQTPNPEGLEVGQHIEDVYRRRKGKGKGKGKGWKGKGGGKGGGGKSGENVTVPYEMFQQMMMMLEQATSGAMPPAMPAMPVSSEPQWKSALNQALQKHSITDKPEYTTAEGGVGIWMGTVTIEGQIYSTPEDESAPNKKAAEQAAAKAALQELYPTEFQKALSSVNRGASAQKGQKRKAGGEHPGNDDPKQKLLNSVQLYVFKKHERNIASEDLAWVVQEFEGPPKTYQGSVTITVHEPSTVYTGEVCDSKKKAEWAAATIALETLKDLFGELEEEHKAKKKKKNQEELQRLKDKHAERQAERQAKIEQKNVLDTA